MDLRCGSKILHGVISDDVIEVSCRSTWCGKRPGVVVIHRFNKHTGELIETVKFKNPRSKEHDTARPGAAVRSA